MKKYLFILFSFISLNSFSLTEGEFEVIQDINSNVADLETNVQLIHNDLNSYLFSDEYKNLIHQLSYFFELAEQYEQTIIGFADRFQSVQDNTLMTGEAVYESMSYLDEILSSQNSIYDFTQSIFYHLTDNWQDIVNGFGRNHTDLIDVRDAIHDLEIKQEGYLSGVSLGVEDIGNGITDIIDILRNQYGSSESDFPKEEIGYYQLENYGKNVSINHLPFQSLETTGEYNKDVHRMLLTLTRLGSSQNNAALSILTNVQVIATALSQDAEGQDKLEKDLEDKEYQATKAEAELSGVTSQNWDSSFTPPRYLSEVHGRLSIGLSDPGLPSQITVMDKFYYETSYFTLEIDPLTFQIPQPLVDLANYGRIVFGFVYWTLTFFLALYLFRLWVRLYMYVSNTLINR